MVSNDSKLPNSARNAIKVFFVAAENGGGRREQRSRRRFFLKIPIVGVRGGEVCTVIGNEIQYKSLGGPCGLVFIVINLILFVNSLV